MLEMFLVVCLIVLSISVIKSAIGTGLKILVSLLIISAILSILGL